MRKLLTPSFHFNVLNDFVIVYNNQAKTFIDQLENHANVQAQFDIYPYVKRCALDIICGGWFQHHYETLREERNMVERE
ncbi:hypothetical protein DICVIV_03046 [Dictyocaulus viviparus]|uniref:Uncharacterized protein n=1 Tax=Dictyocaulus viviparus TaxID=29172 RepID=A0A0D8Y3P8_DICVI|nr:hypothetical protein DICVIV_03046 [Dictyocaulus viviparus]